MLQLFSEFRSIRMNKISEKVFLKINKQIKSLVSKYVSIKNSGVIKLYSFIRQAVTPSPTRAVSYRDLIKTPYPKLGVKHVFIRSDI